MDDFWQIVGSASTLAVAIPILSLLFSLLLLYLVIRLAVMHALRDHDRWMEKKRNRAARSTYPAAQAFPPITPESSDPF
ncbi:MAG: hypothetical protein KF861_08475 [Planctomycetaceae bacterium]|nr:hypothetical protein [Planctomycetaceae bacterium]